MTYSKQQDYGSFMFTTSRIISRKIRLSSKLTIASDLEYVDGDAFAHYSIMEFGCVKTSEGSIVVMCQPLN